MTPPAGIALLPVAAVGKTAGAVGGLAESGLIVRMTRGRLWIGVLATLLFGIVTLNVLSLGLGASTGGDARKADRLERQGSQLRAQIARLQGSDRVIESASALGLAEPGGGVEYLDPDEGDAARAAERLANGELVAAAPIEVDEAGAAPIPEEPATVPPDEAAAPAPEEATAAPADDAAPGTEVAPESEVAPEGEIAPESEAVPGGEPPPAEEAPPAGGATPG